MCLKGEGASSTAQECAGVLVLQWGNSGPTTQKHKHKGELGMVVYTCNPSTQEDEAGGGQVLGQLAAGLPRNTPSKKKKKKRNTRQRGLTGVPAPDLQDQTQGPAPRICLFTPGSRGRATMSRPRGGPVSSGLRWGTG
jgi:hypothetical protein